MVGLFRMEHVKGLGWNLLSCLTTKSIGLCVKCTLASEEKMPSVKAGKQWSHIFTFHSSLKRDITYQ